MTTDPAEPESNAHRFQFRLRSIFILMLITAFSVGVVPLWYHNVIIPTTLTNPARELRRDPYSYYDFEVHEARRHTFLFSFVAFASICGLWFSIASPTNRRSDFWIGSAFGQTFGLLLLPRLWVNAYLLSYWPMTLLLGITNSSTVQQKLILPVFLLACLYSFWPLFLKRYWAAACLLIYSTAYGVLILLYASSSPTITNLIEW